MKILFDLFPVILFFAVFKLAGSNPDTAQALATYINYPADPAHLPVLFATATAIIATLAQIIWVKWRHDKVDTMLWVSFAIILVFGGATLLLHDEAFIKVKPTALYWLFALALLFSKILFRKNLIRSLMEEKMSLPDRIWGQLNLAWSGFFILLGVLNLYVAWNFATDVWVNFKLFGATGIMFVFIIVQAAMVSKYIETEKKDNV
ncbi:MAG: septation protein A [Gallionellales bacterium 35-53-114]|jgi:intracellular septation protein|nr:MAG: septation protein A [Gallionellales bacterium 35-53-114]OYZ65398.1 MAG: septation protein A [Gallionellales bacterium 24-53-125]HQS58242.1 septation protein A [Gallionellaceae bacterium]HQS73797.1 septation protein A [Gallionellaceae bacterium]